MTKSPWFSSSPPISRCSCTLVRRKHSQYTGENYFWHWKVTAERQALNLRAALKKNKKKTARTPVYTYSVHLCVLFSKRTRRDFCAESRTVLFFFLFSKKTTSAKSKARLFFPKQEFAFTITLVSITASCAVQVESLPWCKDLHD